MRAVYSYAVDNNLDVLAAQMKTTPSALKRMAYDNLVANVQQAINAVQPLIGQLDQYNVTQGTVDAWQAALQQLISVLSSPNNAIAHRKATNQQWQVIMRESMLLIHNQADTLASQYSETNPAYYSEYRANRKLKPAGHISTQLRATVVNELDQPIANAAVYIDGTDLKVATDASGYGLISDIPFGWHTVTVITGTNSRTFGPFDFKKGQSLTKKFVTVPAFSTPSTTTTVPVTVSVN
jgi:hypothetical protein